MKSVIYKKFLYDFYPTDLVNTIQNNYPPQGRWTVLDIYLDPLRLGIPPLFTTIHHPFGGKLYIIHLKYSPLINGSNPGANFSELTSADQNLEDACYIRAVK